MREGPIKESRRAANIIEIAVTGVENVADLKAEVRTDFLDATEGLRKSRTRNHAIEDVVAGSETTERAERVLAAFPEKFTLGIIAREADFAGVMFVANFGD